ncbi:glycerol-3-phosphate 1-O-acyltransferase PlsY [bacterium]|nr:glycerol-3-phosphate 1-O-acyltransferase PlsY [bacterium]
MNSNILIILFAVFSFLLGSIPFGLVLSKLVTGKDIRKMGSGNIGATNVLRSAGPTLGILTLALDILKGYIAVKIVQHFGDIANIAYPLEESIFITALSVFLGHIFSIFLKFKGGKGVAVGLGVFLAVSPFSALLGICVFIIVLLLSRFVSLGSIIGSISVIFWTIIFKLPLSTSMLSLVIGLLIVYRHNSNIKRLLDGKESKLFSKKSGE